MRSHRTGLTRCGLRVPWCVAQHFSSSYNIFLDLQRGAYLSDEIPISFEAPIEAPRPSLLSSAYSRAAFTLSRGSGSSTLRRQRAAALIGNAYRAVLARRKLARQRDPHQSRSHAGLKRSPQPTLPTLRMPTLQPLLTPAPQSHPHFDPQQVRASSHCASTSCLASARPPTKQGSSWRLHSVSADDPPG